MSAPLIVLAAGGTGGHVFPAEALAGELIARGYRTALITDVRGKALGVTQAGLDLHVVPSAAMLGQGLLGRARAAVTLARGFLASRKLLKRLKPAVCVGFGGYPSVPPVLAAQRLGLPTVLHEQNSVLGRSNRLLLERAKALATSFAKTLALPPQTPPITWLGNPVRAAIASVPSFALPQERFHILITGGSQGARVFGETIPSALAALPQVLRELLSVSHQVRADSVTAAQETYRAAGIKADCAPFFGDMAKRLTMAHLVIARAGASTVAELTASGRPAILVPLPGSADDHQTVNARALSDHGAAWLVEQPELSNGGLTRRVTELLTNPAGLAEAAKAARALAKPDAAARLADLVLTCAALPLTAVSGDAL